MSILTLGTEMIVMMRALISTFAPLAGFMFLVIGCGDSQNSGGSAAATLAAAPASNSVITQIIDTNGDRAGSPLFTPYGVTTDADGNVYVTGLASDNAFQITPGGTISPIIDATGDGTVDHPLDMAFEIAVGPDGSVYVSGHGTHNVFRIEPDGTITEIIDETGDGTGNLLLNPRHVAVHSNGNVYVAGRTTNNVFEITPGGTITQIIDATGDGTGDPTTGTGNPLGFPAGLAVGPNGNVYVTGDGHVQVPHPNPFRPPIDVFFPNAFRITPAGIITQIIDQAGDGTGNTLAGANDVAVDSNGNVFVTGKGSGNVFRITPVGAITEIIDEDGEFIEIPVTDDSGETQLKTAVIQGLNYADSVAVDSSGNVYVAGYFSANAFMIATPGTCSTAPLDAAPADKANRCSITTIIDANGDGAGNVLGNAHDLAVDPSGNVFVMGLRSANVFRVVP